MFDFHGVPLRPPAFRQQVSHEPTVAFFRAGFRTKQGDRVFEVCDLDLLRNPSFAHQLQKGRLVCGPILGLPIGFADLGAGRECGLVTICDPSNAV